jgi:hypothetical protein
MIKSVSIKCPNKTIMKIFKSIIIKVTWVCISNTCSYTKILEGRRGRRRRHRTLQTLWRVNLVKRDRNKEIMERCVSAPGHVISYKFQWSRHHTAYDINVHFTMQPDFDLSCVEKAGAADRVYNECTELTWPWYCTKSGNLVQTIRH